MALHNTFDSCSIPVLGEKRGVFFRAGDFGQELFFRVFLWGQSRIVRQKKQREKIAKTKSLILLIETLFYDTMKP